MSVRLSPAANLLRNSKLFALPPAINLPVRPPTSNEISYSETATTPFPRFAAIETTYSCGNVGDWGFKRALPLKTVKNTNNPVVRLIRGIDTPEHVADFESAADHVLTLRKFNELDHPIKFAGTDQGIGGNPQTRPEHNHRVFRSSSDNTTNLASSAPHHRGLSGRWSTNPSGETGDHLPAKLREKQIQFNERSETPESKAFSALGDNFQRDLTRNRSPPTRWRYAGPSLVNISGMEFEEYLRTIGKKEVALLKDRVREAITHDRQTSARDSGEVNTTSQKEEITEQEVQDYLRYLRREPAKFGPMIAKILDLPFVAPPKDMASQSDWWEYGANTLASPVWATTGTPKTHPSAGLSYATGTNAVNHPMYGPQLVNTPVVARAVKKRTKVNSNTTQFGVAGFITDGNENTNNKMSMTSKPFEKKDGGMKTAAQPMLAYIDSEGLLRMKIYEHDNFVVRDDRAMTKMESAALDAATNEETKSLSKAAEENPVGRMPSLSRQTQSTEDDNRLDQILGRRR